MKKQHGLYLESLRLQNFATFQNEEIQFNKSFNAIIGETGSGKSLLLDALQMVFGHRADKKLVRKNASFALIEASFQVEDPDVREYVEKIGHPCEGNEIVLKRLVYASGSSKSFLNFQQCSLQTLSDFSKRFIDLVGQFENQKLLNENYQLKLLDSFGSLDHLAESYTKEYSELQGLKSKLQAKSDELTQLRQRQDYLEYQIKELDGLSPTLEDEEELIKKKDHLISGHQNKETLGQALELLSESESGNVLHFLKQIERTLNKTEGQKLSELSEKISESYIQLQDVSYNLSKLFDVDFDESELNEIIERLDRYQRLKRKFGVETSELIKIHQEFSDELDSLSSLELEIKNLEQKIKASKDKAHQLAEQLHLERVKCSKTLSKKLTQFVRKLRMDGATLEYSVRKSNELHKYGVSEVNFLAETNPGEGTFKVKETASGGELSRILLAMRQILSSNDTISVFLFDEIDTGVGGETAVAIGKALEDVSQESQVIAITHLPQIAHFSEQVIVVKKETYEENDKPRTVSLATQLAGEKKKSYVKSMGQVH